MDETGNCANPHHVGNYYTWSATSPNYDGRVVTIFLDQLNNRCNNNTAVPCTEDADCASPGGVAFTTSKPGGLYVCAVRSGS